MFTICLVAVYPLSCTPSCIFKTDKLHVLYSSNLGAPVNSQLQENPKQLFIVHPYDYHTLSATNSLEFRNIFSKVSEAADAKLRIA